MILNICDTKGLQDNQIAAELYWLLCVVLQTLACFFLFTLTLVSLALIPSLRALSPARLVSLRYRRTAWPVYPRCETGRAGDAM